MHPISGNTGVSYDTKDSDSNCETKNPEPPELRDQACNHIQQTYREKTPSEIFPHKLAGNLESKICFQKHWSAHKSVVNGKAAMNTFFISNVGQYLLFHELYYLSFNWLIYIGFDVFFIFSTKKNPKQTNKPNNKPKNQKPNKQPVRPKWYYVAE